MNNTPITPETFLSKCRDLGVSIEIRQGVLTLSKRFQAGSNEEFVKAETDVGIIYEAPQKYPGSTWGTDGGSVGGFSAITNGRMVLNRSGISKRWLNKLQKFM